MEKKEESEEIPNFEGKDLSDVYAEAEADAAANTDKKEKK